jgi:hypothetical protein
LVNLCCHSWLEPGVAGGKCDLARCAARRLNKATSAPRRRACSTAMPSASPDTKNGKAGHVSDAMVTNNTTDFKHPGSILSLKTMTLGVTALGTSGLGTTGLGITGLGSLPSQSGSALQIGTSASTATRSETSCFGDLGTPPANTSTVTARSLSGGVPDPARRLGSSATDAAQRLGGTARVPVTPVPCTTTSTIP